MPELVVDDCFEMVLRVSTAKEDGLSMIFPIVSSPVGCLKITSSLVLAWSNPRRRFFASRFWFGSDVGRRGWARFGRSKEPSDRGVQQLTHGWITVVKVKDLG